MYTHSARIQTAFKQVVCMYLLVEQLLPWVLVIFGNLLPPQVSSRLLGPVVLKWLCQTNTNTI